MSYNYIEGNNIRPCKWNYNHSFPKFTQVFINKNMVSFPNPANSPGLVPASFLYLPKMKWQGKRWHYSRDSEKVASLTDIYLWAEFQKEQECYDRFIAEQGGYFEDIRVFDKLPSFPVIFVCWVFLFIGIKHRAIVNETAT